MVEASLALVGGGCDLPLLGGPLREALWGGLLGNRLRGLPGRGALRRGALLGTA